MNSVPDKCGVRKAVLFGVIFFWIMTAVARAGTVANTHAVMAEGSPPITRIGVVKPSIDLYQFSSGGVGERIESWCEAGCENVTAALEERFGEKMVLVDLDGLEPDLKDELRDIQGLYDMITYSYLQTWYGRAPFPKKYRHFDYSVGEVEDVLDRLGVDALLFVQGLDQIRTSGRKAMEAFAFLAGVVYFANAYVEVGLVGPSGRLLWYNKVNGRVSETDFRELDGARGYLEKVFVEFPVQ